MITVIAEVFEVKNENVEQADGALGRLRRISLIFQEVSALRFFLELFITLNSFSLSKFNSYNN